MRKRAGSGAGRVGRKTPSKSPREKRAEKKARELERRRGIG